MSTLHAETGSQLMLDGLYGWACYLLLGLFGCGLVARAQERAADTRGLLVPVLSVAPYALVVFWLSGDTSLVAARPGTATLVGVVYLLVLSFRILRAAYGFIRARAAILAIALILLAPWMLATLNLDTRLWVADDTQEDQDSDDATEAEALLYDQPSRIAAAVERVAPNTGKKPASRASFDSIRCAASR